MKANITSQDKHSVQLEIEINAETASIEYNKACKKIGERINIPGFRRGKAPRAIIENNVGSDRIKSEVLERILPNVLADNISEHQFDLASEPVIESYKYEIGQPLTIQVKLELKPEVVLGEYKGGSVEVAEFKNAENELEKELQSLCEKFATVESVVGRPAGENDIVNIDFDGSVEGEPIKGGSAKNHQLDISKSNFIKGFAEQIVGKNIGEEFTIDVTFPEEYHDPSLSGKAAQFKIKLNEIKEKHVPELNDDLAKKVGSFNTIEELKADISSYLEKAEKNDNKARAEKAILEKVIEQAQIDIPDSMINREAKALLEEVQSNIKNQGLSWEQVLDAQGHETIWNNLRDEASKRIKSSLVLAAIAKAESLQLNDDDIQSRVVELATMYNTDERAVYKQIAGNPGMVYGLTHQIFSQKIVKFLLDNNEVKYVEDSTKNENQ